MSRIGTSALFCLGILWFSAPLAGQSIEEVARRELRGLRAGHVLGVVFRGEVDYLNAFGRKGLQSEAPLTVGQVFPFPALTEVMVGIVAQALDDAGVLSLEAPISSYLPLVSPRLGRASLGQLLTHTSGLDDAALLKEQSWEHSMNVLSDRAMATQPGMIYSRSRYSFPLAVRVLEKAVGQSFPDLAARAILRPLGMTRSTFDLAEAQLSGLVPGIGRNDDSTGPYRIVEPQAEANGLPVLFTTAGDLLSFLNVWMNGGLRGAPPWADFDPGAGEAFPGDRGFRSGVYLDEHLGKLRAYRTGSGGGYGAAFYLFPRENTAVISWGVGSRSSMTASLAQERLVTAFSPPDPSLEVDEDEAINRALETILDERADSAPPIPELEELIPPLDKGWAGSYLNGEYKVELRERDGALIYFTGEEEWGVEPTRNGSIRAQREDGLAAVVFRLVLGAGGRRYVVIGSKAYLNLADVDW